MRKTRLVILPGARCLHQLGFLLLFLACPTIAFKGQENRDVQPYCRLLTLKQNWLPNNTGETIGYDKVDKGEEFGSRTKGYGNGYECLGNNTREKLIASCHNVKELLGAHKLDALKVMLLQNLSLDSQQKNQNFGQFQTDDKRSSRFHEQPDFVRKNYLTRSSFERRVNPLFRTVKTIPSKFRRDSIERQTYGRLLERLVAPEGRVSPFSSDRLVGRERILENALNRRNARRVDSQRNRKINSLDLYFSKERTRYHATSRDPTETNTRTAANRNLRVKQPIRVNVDAETYPQVKPADRLLERNVLMVRSIARRTLNNGKANRVNDRTAQVLRKRQIFERAIFLNVNERRNSRRAFPALMPFNESGRESEERRNIDRMNRVGMREIDLINTNHINQRFLSRQNIFNRFYKYSPTQMANRNSEENDALLFPRNSVISSRNSESTRILKREKKSLPNNKKRIVSTEMYSVKPIFRNNNERKILMTTIYRIRSNLRQSREVMILSRVNSRIRSFQRNFGETNILDRETNMASLQKYGEERRTLGREYAITKSIQRNIIERRVLGRDSSLVRSRENERMILTERNSVKKFKINSEERRMTQTNTEGRNLKEENLLKKSFERISEDRKILPQMNLLKRSDRRNFEERRMLRIDTAFVRFFGREDDRTSIFRRRNIINRSLRRDRQQKRISVRENTLTSELQRSKRFFERNSEEKWIQGNTIIREIQLGAQEKRILSRHNFVKESIRKNLQERRFNTGKNSLLRSIQENSVRGRMLIRDNFEKRFHQINRNLNANVRSRTNTDERTLRRATSLLHSLRQINQVRVFGKRNLIQRSLLSNDGEKKTLDLYSSFLTHSVGKNNEERRVLSQRRSLKYLNSEDRSSFIHDFSKQSLQSNSNNNRISTTVNEFTRSTQRIANSFSKRMVDSRRKADDYRSLANENDYEKLYSTQTFRTPQINSVYYSFNRKVHVANSLQKMRVSQYSSFFKAEVTLRELNKKFISERQIRAVSQENFVFMAKESNERFYSNILSEHALTKLSTSSSRRQNNIIARKQERSVENRFNLDKRTRKNASNKPVFRPANYSLFGKLSIVDDLYNYMLGKFSIYGSNVDSNTILTFYGKSIEYFNSVFNYLFNNINILNVAVGNGFNIAESKMGRLNNDKFTGFNNQKTDLEFGVDLKDDAMELRKIQRYAEDHYQGVLNGGILCASMFLNIQKTRIY